MTEAQSVRSGEDPGLLVCTSCGVKVPRGAAYGFECVSCVGKRRDALDHALQQCWLGALALAGDLRKVSEDLRGGAGDPLHSAEDVDLFASALRDLAGEARAETGRVWDKAVDPVEIYRAARAWAAENRPGVFDLTVSVLGGLDPLDRAGGLSVYLETDESAVGFVDVPSVGEVPGKLAELLAKAWGSG